MCVELSGALRSRGPAPCRTPGDRPQEPTRSDPATHGGSPPRRRGTEPGSAALGPVTAIRSDDAVAEPRTSGGSGRSRQGAPDVAGDAVCVTGPPTGSPTPRLASMTDRGLRAADPAPPRARHFRTEGPPFGAGDGRTGDPRLGMRDEHRVAAHDLEVASMVRRTGIRFRHARVARPRGLGDRRAGTRASRWRVARDEQPVPCLPSSSGALSEAGPA